MYIGNIDDLVKDIKLSKIPKSFEEFRKLTDGVEVVQVFNNRYLLNYYGMHDWIVSVWIVNVLRPVLTATLVCPVLEEAISVKIHLDFLEPEYCWNTVANDEMVVHIKSKLAEGIQ